MAYKSTPLDAKALSKLKCTSVRNLIFFFFLKTLKINFSNLRISDDNIITEHIDWDTSTKVAFERDLPA